MQPFVTTKTDLNALELYNLLTQYSSSMQGPETENLLRQYQSKIERCLETTPETLTARTTAGSTLLLEAMLLPMNNKNLSRQERHIRVNNTFLPFVAAIDKIAARKDDIGKEAKSICYERNKIGLSPLIAAADCGDDKIFSAILGQVNKYWKDMGRDAYAEQFIRPSDSESTLLYKAISGNNPRIYRNVVDGLETLKKAKLIDEGTFNQQFTRGKKEDNTTPLLKAAHLKNPELFGLFMDDFDKLPLDTRKQQLQHCNTSRANVLKHSCCQ